jgi:hypothetical protein
MQTNGKATQTREDILNGIEECEEALLELQHKLRWYTLGVRVFQVSLAICVVGVVITSIGVPFLEGLLQTTTTIAGFVAAVVGIIVGITRLISIDSSTQIELNDDLEDLRVTKLKQAKLKRKLAYFDEHALDHLPHRELYTYQLPDLITDYRKRADIYRWWFIVTQLITIVLSAAITSISGGWLDKYISIPWLIPVISGTISILTSITLFFKFREKGFNLQQTADAIDLELKAYQLRIEDYEGLDDEKALTRLVTQTEKLRREQQKRQQQLEQSSQAEQKPLQSPAS